MQKGKEKERETYETRRGGRGRVGIENSTRIWGVSS